MAEMEEEASGATIGDARGEGAAKGMAWRGELGVVGGATGISRGGAEMGEMDPRGGVDGRRGEDERGVSLGALTGATEGGVGMGDVGGMAMVEETVGEDGMDVEMEGGSMGRGLVVGGMIRGSGERRSSMSSTMLGGVAKAVARRSLATAEVESLRGRVEGGTGEEGVGCAADGRTSGGRGVSGEGVDGKARARRSWGGVGMVWVARKREIRERSRGRRFSAARERSAATDWSQAAGVVVGEGVGGISERGGMGGTSMGVLVVEEEVGWGEGSSRRGAEMGRRGEEGKGGGREEDGSGLASRGGAEARRGEGEEGCGAGGMGEVASGSGCVGAGEGAGWGEENSRRGAERGRRREGEGWEGTGELFSRGGAEVRRGEGEVGWGAGGMGEGARGSGCVGAGDGAGWGEEGSRRGAERGRGKEGEGREGAGELFSRGSGEVWRGEGEVGTMGCASGVGTSGEGGDWRGAETARMAEEREGEGVSEEARADWKRRMASGEGADWGWGLGEEWGMSSGGRVRGVRPEVSGRRSEGLEGEGKSMEIGESIRFPPCGR